MLHADRVDLETTGGTRDTRGALTGRLTLYGRKFYGRKREEKWRAELDLKQYALSALMLTS